MPSENTGNKTFEQRFNIAVASAELIFPASAKCDAAADLLHFLNSALQNFLANTALPNPEIQNLPKDEDPLFFLNRLLLNTLKASFSDSLEQWIFQSAYSLFSDCRIEAGKNFKTFFLEHVRVLCSELRTLIPDYVNYLIRENHSEGKLLRIYPGWQCLISRDIPENQYSESWFSAQIERKRIHSALFSDFKIYRFSQGNFIPLKLRHIRPVSNFYGYREARRILNEHYTAFSKGSSNLPLLISSLPGLGKTQMNISHVLNCRDLTLILPEPDDIATGLETLISTLKGFPEHKFVLFFDDIDADKTDWYFFRTQVGGTFSLPENITITVASNQKFPASVSSRGRGFEFPIFDEIRCMEMVTDYLSAHGMKNPTSNLVFVIASDYVEEFGQRKFEELSPRTLVRYLEQLDSDRDKRSKMLKFSQGDLIPRPDSQVFYEENLKLMKNIYGDAVLEEFRNQELNGNIV